MCGSIDFSLLCSMTKTRLAQPVVTRALDGTGIFKAWLELRPGLRFFYTWVVVSKALLEVSKAFLEVFKAWLEVSKAWLEVSKAWLGSALLLLISKQRGRS